MGSFRLFLVFMLHWAYFVFSSQPPEKVCALQEELGYSTPGRSEGPCQKEGTCWRPGWFGTYLLSKKFIERYHHLHVSNAAQQSQAKKRTTATGKNGRRRNIDDTASENSDTGGDLGDPERPWFAEWNLYTTTHENVSKDMGIVQWWGVSSVFRILLWLLNYCIAQCTSVSHMGVSRTRLLVYYGILCFEWEGFFVSRNHHQ